MHSESNTNPGERDDLRRVSLDRLDARAVRAIESLQPALDGEIIDEADHAAARVRAYKIGRIDTLAVFRSWIVAERNALDLADAAQVAP